MFDLGSIFKIGDLISDVTGIKQRTVKQIKFFRYDKGNLGIAFYDNQTIHGEYWLNNIPVPPEYETIFENSGFNLKVKYDITLLGIQPFLCDKKVLETPAIQKRLLTAIFEAIK